MAAKKPASLKRQGRETAKESPKLVPQPNGRGALLSGGLPGNKGGGRPKDEFQARMRELASGEEALNYFEQCLRGDHGYKAHTSAMSFAAEHGYGKPTDHVEVSGKDGGPIAMTVTFRK